MTGACLRWGEAGSGYSQDFDREVCPPRGILMRILTWLPFWKFALLLSFTFLCCKSPYIHVLFWMLKQSKSSHCFHVNRPFATVGHVTCFSRTH